MGTIPGSCHGASRRVMVAAHGHGWFPLHVRRRTPEAGSWTALEPQKLTKYQPLLHGQEEEQVRKPCLDG